MPMEPERNYFQEGNILITNSRAVFGSRIYVMDDIKSAYISEMVSLRGFGIIITTMGTLLSIFALIGQYGIALFLLNLLFAGMGIYIITLKPRYIVRLNGWERQFKALHSSDKAYIQRIVYSINKAKTDHYLQ